MCLVVLTLDIFVVSVISATILNYRRYSQHPQAISEMINVPFDDPDVSIWREILSYRGESTVIKAYSVRHLSCG